MSKLTPFPNYAVLSSSTANFDWMSQDRGELSQDLKGNYVTLLKVLLCKSHTNKGVTGTIYPLSCDFF